MAKRGEVVIVSGPPGSGKSTVAAALASEAENGVHLETDWFYHTIQSGFVAPHLPEAHSQNTAVVDVAADAAAGFAQAGYSVMWDGIVGPWFLDRVARRLASRDIAMHYLVLRPTRATALARVSQRDDTTDVSGAEIMFDQFANLGEFEANVIDGDSDRALVFAECRAAIASGGLRILSEPWVDDRWPVSVKGVLGWDDRFVVLRNRRGEWELPGGRMDATDDSPMETLRREMTEELGLDVEVGELIDSWIYEVEGKRVLILTYQCHAEQPSELMPSDEHSDVGQFSIDELAREAFPEGYLQSTRTSRSMQTDSR